MATDFDSYDAQSLNQVLRSFYASEQNATSKPHPVASYIAVQSGISRHFPMLDIMKSSFFTSSNGVFKSVIKILRKNRQCVPAPPSISATDLQLIRALEALSPHTASRLVKKVWFKVQLHLARRVRVGNRNLTRDAYELKQDENRIKYFTLAHNLKTKNHKDAQDLCKQNYMLPWTQQLQP